MPGFTKKGSFVLVDPHSNAIKSDPTFSVSEVNVDSSIRYGKSFNESYEPQIKLEGAQE